MGNDGGNTLISRYGSFPALLAGLVLLFTYAPNCLAKEWEIKEFEVVAIEPLRPGWNVASPPAVEELGETLSELLIQLSRLAPGDFESVNARALQMDGDTKKLIESMLNLTAIALESWGFPEPNLAPVVTTEDGRRAYRVYIVRGNSDVMPDPAPRGAYHIRPCNSHREPIITLNEETVLYYGSIQSVEALKTISHELVHAVQHNTNFFASGCTEGAGDWITEGTADAIAWDIVRYADPDSLDMSRALHTSLEQVAAEELWGGRSYSELRLPQPTVGRAADMERNTYYTASFWRYLAEYEASLRSGAGPPGPAPGPVDYSYLRDFFTQEPTTRDCLQEGDECDAEVTLLDGWLKNRYGDQGLRDRFTRFVGNLVRYDEYRPPGLGIEVMRYDTLGGCEKLEPILSKGLAAGDKLSISTALSYRDTAGARTPRTSGGMPDLAAWCRKLELQGFGEGKIPVEAIAHAPNRELLEQLSAVISLPEGSLADTRPAVETGYQGHVQARWIFSFENGKTTPFLLTNVAKNAADTVPLSGRIPITFTALVELAEMTSGSGPSASQIDSPIVLELDQVHGTVVRDREAADNPDACYMSLRLHDGAGTEVGLVMSHDGPIGPGTYDVNATSKSMYLRWPQKYTGRFGLGVTLGPDHTLSVDGLRQDGFMAQAGTVEIDSVVSGLVRGRVRGVLERCLDCVAIGKKPRRGLTNLVVSVEFAALISDPEFRYSRGKDRYGSNCLATDAPVTPGSRGKKRAGNSGNKQPESGSQDSEAAQSGRPAPDPNQDGAASKHSSETGKPAIDNADSSSEPGQADTTAQGGSNGGQLPARVNAVLLQATGDVEKTVMLSGDRVRITGGCTGSGRMSIGFSRGNPSDEDWLSFALDTADTVSTGATGQFPLREVRWDNGIEDFTIPGGNTIKAPNRFKGPGSLTLNSHDATLSNRRMTGSVIADVSNMEGETASLSAKFGINLSCGVR